MTITVELLLGVRAGLAGALDPLVSARNDDHAFLPAERALGRADALIDVWLDDPDTDCCTICIGLEVTIDGRSWTDHYLDHLGPVGHWFEGVATLARAGAGASHTTWVWDESCLHLERDDPYLRMWDERWAIFDGAWWPVAAPWSPFVRALVRAGDTLVALQRELLAACDARGMTHTRRMELLPGPCDQPKPAHGCDGRLAVVRQQLESVEIERALAELRRV